MAKSLLCSSTLNPFFSTTLSSSTSSKRNQIAYSGSNKNETSSLLWNRRDLSLGFMSSLVAIGLVSNDRRRHDANAAILEADDDEELLEKVKQDRKKRIERQAVLNSAVKEKGTSSISLKFYFIEIINLSSLCVCVCVCCKTWFCYFSVC